MITKDSILKVYNEMCMVKLLFFFMKYGLLICTAETIEGKEKLIEVTNSV